MKTRNFFLGIFGFTILGFILFVIAEIIVNNRRTPPSVITSPSINSSENPEDTLRGPDWVIPLPEIETACENPWIIPTTVTKLNNTLLELVSYGLSECYTSVGEDAFASHLWHQGVDLAGSPPTLSDTIQYLGENVEIYFNYDADFEKLGLPNPETVSLSGYIIHDLNGDALSNPGEPRIPNVEICIQRKTLNEICQKSGNDGEYRFDKILPGGWRFLIKNPNNKRLNAFRYTNHLVQENYHVLETEVNGYIIKERYLNLSEFLPIEEEFLELVDGDREQDFYLMQEWATYFSSQEDIRLFSIQSYYDFDVRSGFTRIFDGSSGPTYDQHDGLDVSCPIGTEILSVAEGRVIAIFDNSTVLIRHDNQLVSVYGHGIPLVEENQFVPRGYPVALCDELNTGGGPHLHFAVWKNTHWLPLMIYEVPVYADLVHTTEEWVANQAPLDDDHFIYLLHGGRGIWTEINNPHFPYAIIFNK
jgi:hypothetical protein